MMDKELRRIGHPYAFRYRSDNDNTLDEIEKNYIYFANREQLNDPFDSCPAYIDLSKSKEEIELLKSEIQKNIPDDAKSYFENKMNLQEFASSKMEEFILSFGIGCFSMHLINYNLWANYANKHKGICMQYNINNDPTFFHNLLPVIYLPELNRIEYKPISQSNGIVNLFYHKLDQWSNEKELRLIKSNPGKLQHDKKALRNIIIGYKSDIEFIEKLLSVVKSNYSHVGVYQMKEPKDPNKATFVHLNA
jgi:Protein of unknown function (DUF2971)